MQLLASYHGTLRCGSFDTERLLALGIAAALLLLDAIGWRIVSAAFDRERLITGTR